MDEDTNITNDPAEQATVPGTHEMEPEVEGVEAVTPDLDLPDDDEAVEFEKVDDSDLPDIDPASDPEDEDAVLDDDEEN